MSSLEKKPVGMSPPPISLPIGILLQHHSKLDTGFPVAVITEIMETNHLRLTPVLGKSRNRSGENQSQHGTNNDVLHGVVPVFSAARCGKTGMKWGVFG